MVRTPLHTCTLYNPYTVLEGAAINVEDAPTIWIGYYQDNTDQAGVVDDAELRAGHYQALVEVEAVEVETEVAHEAVENRHDDEMKVKINSEVKILKLLFSEADVIEPCLSLLLAYDISADDLLNTNICTVLYTKVYPLSLIHI